LRVVGGADVGREVADFAGLVGGRLVVVPLVAGWVDEIGVHGAEVGGIVEVPVTEDRGGLDAVGTDGPAVEGVPSDMISVLGVGAISALSRADSLPQDARAVASSATTSAL